MNPNTNELREMQSEAAMKVFSKQGFEPLPKDLQHAAKRKLKGKKSVFVSKTSGGKLSKWAAKRRKEKKKQTKNQMVMDCQAYYNKLRENKNV